MSLDFLGATMPLGPAVARAPMSWSSAGIAAGAGLMGSLLWRQHPVLGFLGFSAIASNAHAVIAGDRMWKDATRRVGRHLMATAASLALPMYPVVGYVAGAVGAELLLDGKGGGIIEEWADYIDLRKPKAEVIDVVDVTPKADQKTTALAKAA